MMIYIVLRNGHQYALPASSQKDFEDIKGMLATWGRWLLWKDDFLVRKSEIVSITWDKAAVSTI